MNLKFPYPPLPDRTILKLTKNYTKLEMENPTQLCHGKIDGKFDKSFERILEE